jgi:endonuclease/exonuclease/phosphatase (EEP) superfamily protein YafD
VQTFERAGLLRSCRGPRQACGATFPGPTVALPAVFEIDHILGRGVEFDEARVIRAGGSDHFPVFATFSVKR